MKYTVKLLDGFVKDGRYSTVGQEVPPVKVSGIAVLKDGDQIVKLFDDMATAETAAELLNNEYELFVEWGRQGGKVRSEKKAEANKKHGFKPGNTSWRRK